MEKRTLILAAVAASSLAMLAERRYSMSEKIQDDEDVFDRIFNEPFPGDYILDVGPAYDLPYERIDREDVKLIPDFFLADRPAPDFGSLRAQIGGRIRGPQVLLHRRPVRRHA